WPSRKCLSPASLRQTDRPKLALARLNESLKQWKTSPS
ncbi:MAG: hypothetical protein AVDCRST_MAG31-1579, partial [uncultured Sphingomonas sp.]